MTSHIEFNGGIVRRRKFHDQARQDIVPLHKRRPLWQRALLKYASPIAARLIIVGWVGFSLLMIWAGAKEYTMPCECVAIWLQPMCHLAQYVNPRRHTGGYTRIATKS